MCLFYCILERCHSVEVLFMEMLSGSAFNRIFINAMDSVLKPCRTGHVVLALAILAFAPICVGLQLGHSTSRSCLL